MPFAVHQVRLAVDDARQRVVRSQRVDNLLQGIVLVKAVAGIEETEVIARGQRDALVHGVIESAIRFADHAGNAVAVTVDDASRPILRRTVHDDVLHMMVGLGDDALDSVFQHSSGIVGDGNHAEYGSRTVVHRSGESQSLL